MAELTVAQLAAGVLGAAAFVTALAVLWRWSKLGELVKGTRLFLVDWFGEPERPGRPALPSFPARMAKVEACTQELSGGLRDELGGRLLLLAHNVDRVHEQGTTSAERLAQLDARVSDHRRRNDEQVALLREAIARNEAALQEVKRRGLRHRAGDPDNGDTPSKEG